MDSAWWFSISKKCLRTNLISISNLLRYIILIIITMVTRIETTDSDTLHGIVNIFTIVFDAAIVVHYGTSIIGTICLIADGYILTIGVTFDDAIGNTNLMDGAISGAISGTVYIGALICGTNFNNDTFSDTFTVHIIIYDVVYSGTAIIGTIYTMIQLTVAVQ